MDDNNIDEGKEHTVPKTDKEKKLAKLAPPYDKITHKDVLKGRGVVEAADEVEQRPGVPFSGPYRKTSSSVTDKSGAKHDAMSRVRHIARQAMQKAAKKQMKEDAEQIQEVIGTTTGYSDSGPKVDAETRKAHQTRNVVTQGPRAGKITKEVQNKLKDKIKNRMTKEEVELEEKHLTPAEMKKREEIAKAMEKQNPGIPMGKKMAIATAQAKKVAEEAEHMGAIIDTVERVFRKHSVRDHGALEAVRQGVKHHFSKSGATAKSAIEGISNILDKRMHKSGNYSDLSRVKEALRQGVAHHLKKQSVTKEEAEQIEEAKATYCGRCKTTHVPPSMGGKCPALKEDAEQVEERADMWHPDPEKDRKMGGRGQAILARQTKAKPASQNNHLDLLKRLASAGHKIAAGKSPSMTKEEVEQVDEASYDSLGLRSLFSTDPKKQPFYKTQKGREAAAKKNVPDLKASIKSTLGKHPKPNLPEEVEQIDEAGDWESTATPTAIKIHHTSPAGKKGSTMVFSAKDASAHEKELKKAGHKVTHRQLMYGEKGGKMRPVNESVVTYGEFVEKIQRIRNQTD